MTIRLAIGVLAVEQCMLRESTNPLSRLPRFHRTVRYFSLRYSVALFAYIDVSVARGRAAEPAAGLRSPRPGRAARAELRSPRRSINQVPQS